MGIAMSVQWVNQKSSQEIRTNFNITVHTQITPLKSHHLHAKDAVQRHQGHDFVKPQCCCCRVLHFTLDFFLVLVEVQPKQSFAYIVHHRKLCSTLIRDNISKTPLCHSTVKQEPYSLGFLAISRTTSDEDPYVQFCQYRSNFIFLKLVAVTVLVWCITVFRAHSIASLLDIRNSDLLGKNRKWEVGIGHAIYS